MPHNNCVFLHKNVSNGVLLNCAPICICLAIDIIERHTIQNEIDINGIQKEAFCKYLMIMYKFTKWKLLNKYFREIQQEKNYERDFEFRMKYYLLRSMIRIILLMEKRKKMNTNVFVKKVMKRRKMLWCKYS